MGEDSSSEGKAEVKFPQFIEVEGERAIIRTVAGDFHLPKEMLSLYIDDFSVTQENFEYALPAYIGENKHDENPATIKIRNDVHQFLDTRGLNPKDFLDEYGYAANKDRIMELWGVIPQQILEEIMFCSLQGHFSPRSGNVTRTQFEHVLVAGGSPEFFGQMFMGEFKADLQWQQETRKKRQEQLSGPGLQADQGITLFTNKDNYMRGAGRDYHKSTEAGTEELGKQVRSKLGKLYEQAKKGKVKFDEIDYTRVVMKATQFDEAMQAFPEPVRLEFIHGREVVATVDDPKELGILRPSTADCKLADRIKRKDGTECYVEIETQGSDHNLSFTDNKMDWYNRYLSRISQEG